jgi:cyclase
MTPPRVIPVLLLTESGVVKTRKFDQSVYVGDATNAVRIFNQKEVDEIVILDIEATKHGRPPDYSRLIGVCEEAFMPLAYGGGVSSVQQMEQLFRIGVEKVVLNSAIYQVPELVRASSDLFGSQSVVVSVDVKKDLFGRYKVYSHSGTNRVQRDMFEVIDWVQEQGAGEVILNSIDRDGMRVGLDLDLVSAVAKRISVPLVAMGGIGEFSHIREALLAGASAVAAGSMFVFHGAHRAVLISYLSTEEIKALKACAQI